MEEVSCRICENRKPRRYCPGVRGDICAPCCGEQREVTIDCPLDCSNLVEARKHEQRSTMALEDFPNQDVRITEAFLERNQTLFLLLGMTVLQAGLDNSGVVDSDVRDALQALIRTYRTKESGLIYETRSPNPYAAGVQARVEEAVEAYRRDVAERTGMHQVRDAEVLGCLVFLERLELQRNNGRRRGRAFLSFLHGELLPPEVRAAGS